MKKAIVGCGIGLLLLSSAACQNGFAPQALHEAPTADERGHGQNIGYGMFGPGPVNYPYIYDPPEIRHEGEMNFSPSYRTLTPDRPNLGEDQDHLREIIEMQGFTPGMIYTFGSHAWVNAHNAGHETGPDKEKKIKQLRAALQRGMPRYQIHLSAD